MAERIVNSESQNQAIVNDWTEGLSNIFDSVKEIHEGEDIDLRIAEEVEKRIEIDPLVLRSVLENNGAHFENLSEEGKKGLSMYSERMRKKGLREIWGDKFKRFGNWASEEYPQDFKNRTGRELSKTKNVKDLKNKDRVASERQDKGLIDSFGDLNALAAGLITIEQFKMIYGARLRNSVRKSFPVDERGKIMKSYFTWDREVLGDEPVTKDPRYHPLTGEEIPVDKQVIKPVSIPLEFPKQAIQWLKNN